MTELPKRLDAEMDASMQRARQAAAAARHSPSPSSYRSVVFPVHETIFAPHRSPPSPPPPPVLVSPPRPGATRKAHRADPVREESDERRDPTKFIILPSHSPLRRKTFPMISVSPPRAGGPAVFAQSYASVSHLHIFSGGIVGSPPPPPQTSTGRRRAISPRAAVDHITESYMGLCPRISPIGAGGAPAWPQVTFAAQACVGRACASTQTEPVSEG